MALTQLDDAVTVMRIEYAELPGLKLSKRQAQRLWNFPEDVCTRALEILTESRFLARTVDGAYVRRLSSPASLDHWRTPPTTHSQEPR